jgi:hypothetical protein
MKIISTPETIAEAKRALNEFLERSRRAPQSLPDSTGAISNAKGSTDMDIATDDNIELHLQDAQCSARQYCAAREKNLRPLRQIDETDENARAGRDSALSFLEKRRRSVIRK